MRIHLGRIIVYPIKALDGLEVAAARITGGGILEHDRVYRIADSQQKAVNGKRHARVHLLRSQFDPDLREVSFAEQGGARAKAFPLDDPAPINRWLSEFFGFEVALEREDKGGFPDDKEAFGPTIVSRPSLETIAAWYPGLDLPNVRRRFRANLELDAEGMPAFWEDQLFSAAGVQLPFDIGEVRFRGHNPCQRCVVPTRDPDTGAGTPRFQLEFMERRKAALPPWADASRFNHFYRFAVNTSILPSEAGKVLRVGDAVELPVADSVQPGSR